MTNVKTSNSETAFIRCIFILSGLMCTLPSHSIINVSVMLNDVYKIKIMVGILGSLSSFMIISSFLQMSSSWVSYKCILYSYLINVVNLILLIFLATVIKVPAYIICILTCIVGFFLGYSYSASIKFSLLFPKEDVNRYLTIGISFSALFHYVINLIVTLAVVEENVMHTYYTGIQLSLGASALVIIMGFLLIYILRKNSPGFMEVQKVIESFYKENVSLSNKSTITNHQSTTQVIVSFNELEKKQQNEKKKQELQTNKEKEDIKSGIKKNTDNYWNTNISHCDAEKNNMLTENYGTEEKKNWSFLKKDSSKLLTISEKWKQFKNSFNYQNIFLGAKLIKRYYRCYLGVTYTIFITFIVYPNMIPLDLDKGMRVKYFFMLASQTSDLFGNFLVIYSNVVRNFIGKHICELTFSRTSLLITALYIRNLNAEHILYSNFVIACIAILIGLTNGSLINTSYSKIRNCFENDELKKRNISCASSFTSLSFLSCFALSPWAYYLLTHI